jgi:hypothetical protein
LIEEEIPEVSMACRKRLICYDNKSLGNRTGNRIGSLWQKTNNKSSFDKIFIRTEESVKQRKCEREGVDQM